MLEQNADEFPRCIGMDGPPTVPPAPEHTTEAVVDSINVARFEPGFESTAAHSHPGRAGPAWVVERIPSGFKMDLSRAKVTVLNEFSSSPADCEVYVPRLGFGFRAALH